MEGVGDGPGRVSRGVASGSTGVADTPQGILLTRRRTGPHAPSRGSPSGTGPRRPRDETNDGSGATHVPLKRDLFHLRRLTGESFKRRQREDAGTRPPPPVVRKGPRGLTVEQGHPHPHNVVTEPPLTTGVRPGSGSGPGSFPRHTTDEPRSFPSRFLLWLTRHSGVRPGSGDNRSPSGAAP